MRTFMAAIVGLVIIGTAAWAQDKQEKNKKDNPTTAPAGQSKDTHYGASGTAEGKLISVATDGSFVVIEGKKGGKHEIKVGPNTQVTADGKSVEGGVKNLKLGSNVTISWETDTHGKHVGTEIRMMERLAD